MHKSSQTCLYKPIVIRLVLDRSQLQNLALYLASILILDNGKIELCGFSLFGQVRVNIPVVGLLHWTSMEAAFDCSWFVKLERDFPSSKHRSSTVIRLFYPCFPFKLISNPALISLWKLKFRTMQVWGYSWFWVLWSEMAHGFLHMHVVHTICSL